MTRRGKFLEHCLQHNMRESCTFSVGKTRDRRRHLMMNGNGSGNSSAPRATLESPARVCVCSSLTLPLPGSGCGCAAALGGSSLGSPGISFMAFTTFSQIRLDSTRLASTLAGHVNLICWQRCCTFFGSLCVNKSNKCRQLRELDTESGSFRAREGEEEGDWSTGRLSAGGAYFVY